MEKTKPTEMTENKIDKLKQISQLVDKLNETEFASFLEYIESKKEKKMITLHNNLLHELQSLHVDFHDFEIEIEEYNFDPNDCDKLSYVVCINHQLRLKATCQRIYGDYGFKTKCFYKIDKEWIPLYDESTNDEYTCLYNLFSFPTMSLSSFAASIKEVFLFMLNQPF